MKVILIFILLFRTGIVSVMHWIKPVVPFFMKKRPVDIVIGTKDYFERRTKEKSTFMIEGEVMKKGILLYDSSDSSEFSDEK